MDRHSLAFLATVLAVFALDGAQDAQRGGSVLAIPVVALLALAHARLLSRNEESGTAAAPRAVAAAAPYVAAGALLLSIHFQLDAIFAKAVSPFRSSQLGLTLQANEALREGLNPYAMEFELDGFKSRSPFLPAMTLPYLLAREYGLDVRFASLGLFAVAAAAAGALWLRAERRDPLPLLAIAALALAPGFIDSLQYGNAAPVWPLIAFFAFALSARWRVAAALAAGLLAAASPGWVLLLPLTLLAVFRLLGGSPVPIVLAGLLPVTLTAGVFFNSLDDLAQAILLPMFSPASGASDETERLWRMPTFSALATAINFGPVLWLGALTILAALARRIWRSDSRSAAGRDCIASSLVLGSFVTLAAAPTAFAFQYYAHLLLLGMLSPLRSGPGAVPVRFREFAPLPLLPVAVAAFAWVWIARADIEALSRRPLAMLRHDRGLDAGWSIPARDHVWGNERIAEVSFALDRPIVGYIDTRLGSLPGEWAPMNETEVFVNGRRKLLWRSLPGRFEDVRIPVDQPGDLVAGRNAISFRTAYARSPKSLGIGDDPRTLSIAWHGMRLVESKDAALSPLERMEKDNTR